MTLSSNESMPNNRENQSIKLQARVYLAKGWSVIPVNSKDKKGSYINSWKPYQNKLPTNNQIDDWWNQ
jgi:hypothetical protein